MSEPRAYSSDELCLKKEDFLPGGSLYKPWWPRFMEGVIALSYGDGFLDNPYINKQDDACRHWVDGYVSAFIASKSPDIR